MTEQDQLDAIRDRIDAIDEQIQELLNQRARAAQEVARVKQAAGEGTVFYRPDREAQVMRRVMERNQGPLSGETVALLFREIMSACLALEQPLRVAFLGPAGTFTQEAAIRHFGHAVHTEPMSAIDQVFRWVGRYPERSRRRGGMSGYTASSPVSPVRKSPMLPTKRRCWQFAKAKKQWI